jgi:hypothetical protein
MTSHCTAGDVAGIKLEAECLVSDSHYAAWVPSRRGEGKLCPVLRPYITRRPSPSGTGRARQPAGPDRCAGRRTTPGHRSRHQQLPALAHRPGTCRPPTAAQPPARLGVKPPGRALTAHPADPGPLRQLHARHHRRRVLQSGPPETTITWSGQQFSALVPASYLLGIVPSSCAMKEVCTKLGSLHTGGSTGGCDGLASHDTGLPSRADAAGAICSGGSVGSVIAGS